MKCGACGEKDVTICHAICSCVGTQENWQQLVHEVPAPRRNDVDGTLRFVFSYERDETARTRCIDFVGASLIACLAADAPHGLVRGEDHVEDEDVETEGRLMAMLRLEAAEAAEVAGVNLDDAESSSDSE